MARIKGPVWKKSRRLGFSILETGEELQRRQYAPGQHGPTKRIKLTNYGLQLREKQRIRYMYGINERQFANLFKKAANAKGVTGDNFLAMLESRLDNLVYRMGFARTRRAARQLVNHGHILVNGKKVDVPSYTVEENDVITVRAKSKEMLHFKAVREGNASRILPKWLTFNADELTATVVALPVREDIDFALQENMIVEFYSR